MCTSILVAGILLTIIAGCSGSSNSSPSGSYGGSTASSGSGGAASTVSNTSAGGSLAGATAMTGGAASGGTSTAVGGSSVTDTDGQPGSGGAGSTGGKPATGGNGATGGAVATGGVTATGGRTSTVGTSSTGGISANGGNSTGTPTGGRAAATGGKSAALGGSGSTSVTGCTREMLQTHVDAYMTAVQAGDASALSSASYKENGATVALGSGLWATPLKVDQLPPLTALDVDRCEAYVEVIVNNSHEYVFGARLTASASTGELTAISIIATDCDDWGFNAATYLQYSKAEQASGGWGDVAAADRLSRQELQDAGYAYFAYWGDKSVAVPWGKPCSRLEGGMYTGANGTCDVGIPDQSFAPQPTGALIDVDRGMAVVFVNLPGPDSHWFRVNQSGIRYIHTLTVCYVNGVWQCPGEQPTCS